MVVQFLPCERVFVCDSKIECLCSKPELDFGNSIDHNYNNYERKRFNKDKRGSEWQQQNKDIDSIASYLIIDEAKTTIAKIKRTIEQEVH